MATIEDVIDNAILAVVLIAGVYGIVILFWSVIFPAIAGKDEGDER